MTIQFKVDSTYTLGSSIKLICTYIEDNTVWLKSIVCDNLYPVLYKLERKTNKLYVFNDKVQAYDSVENTLSEGDLMSQYKPEGVTVYYGFMGD